MQCNFCQNKATVFLTQLVEGQMKKICLCDDCAKERGVTDPTGFSLAESLLGAESTPGIQGAISGAVGVTSKGRACPNCGFTMEDLRRVRRFGCSECYHTFGEEVQAMLRGMHAGTSHVGKVPRGQMESRERRQRIEQLRTRLEQAISAENYEEAAGLRDEIREIETQAVPKP
jgi:protein arginine kinase activator